MTAPSHSPRRNVMKSFRLYLWPPPPIVDRIVTDYSPKEITDWQDEFAIIARRHRGYQTNAIWSGIALAALVTATIIVSKVFWLPAFVACAVLVVLRLNVYCPACGNNLEEVNLGRFCPQCGSDSLQPAGWFRWACCNACGKSLQYGKGGRLFKIRSCTHCGLPLDEQGI